MSNVVSNTEQPSLRVLMVAEAGRAATLAASFRTAGFEVTHAESVLYALTWLERDRPDVIVSVAELVDMSGADLLEIVRDDAGLADTVFLLLGGSAATRLTPGERDQVLHSSAGPEEVLAVSLEKLYAAGRISRGRAILYGAKGGQQDIKMRGSLEVFTLFDLTLSLTQGKQSGRLHLFVREAEAVMRFFDGRLVHAEYRGERGEAAVIGIFSESDGRSDTEFFFEALRPPGPDDPVTIFSAVDPLLLRVAVALDHLRHRQRGSLA